VEDAPVTPQGDETSIEKVIDVWGEQESIRSIKLFRIVGGTPWLDVTSAEMAEAGNARQAAARLDQPYVELEDSLPTSGLSYLHSLKLPGK